MQLSRPTLWPVISHALQVPKAIAASPLHASIAHVRTGLATAWPATRRHRPHRRHRCAHNNPNRACAALQSASHQCQTPRPNLCAREKYLAYDSTLSNHFETQKKSRQPWPRWAPLRRGAKQAGSKLLRNFLRPCLILEADPLHETPANPLRLQFQKNQHLPRGMQAKPQHPTSTDAVICSQPFQPLLQWPQRHPPSCHLEKPAHLRATPPKRQPNSRPATHNANQAPAPSARAKN